MCIRDRSEPGYKLGFRKISDITIERAKRVLVGYNGQPGIPDTGFKVYSLVKSAFPRVEFAPDPAKTEAENIELLRKYIREKEATFHIQFEKEKVIDEVLL